MYRERLSVPWWWWLLALLLAASFVVAIWAILGDQWGLGSLLGAVALVSLALRQWSRASITVDGDVLQAAGARIEGRWLASVEVLDAEATRTAAARASTTGDHLVLRPWLPRAVQVHLADPADPHPTWLVATRRPEALATAISHLIPVPPQSPMSDLSRRGQP